MIKIDELAGALLQKEMKLAVAESCTGGLIAAGLTDQAGSSEWFECGFVTYSNKSKMNMLSVPKSTIEQYGAVSEQTAIAMVEGIFTHSTANIALSVTGIAGPSGGSEEKPVGTVCFGYGIAGQKIISKTMLFAGNRQEIRENAKNWAYQTLLQTLSGK